MEPYPVEGLDPAAIEVKDSWPAPLVCSTCPTVPSAAGQFLPVLSANEGGDVFQWTRSIKRVHGNQVRKIGGLEVLEVPLHAHCINSTRATLAPSPIIIFIKSLPTNGNTLLNLCLPVNCAIASSRPANIPTNTQVVDIGISFSSLKKYKHNQ